MKKKEYGGHVGVVISQDYLRIPLAEVPGVNSTPKPQHTSWVCSGEEWKVRNWTSTTCTDLFPSPENIETITSIPEQNNIPSDVLIFHVFNFKCWLEQYICSKNYSYQSKIILKTSFPVNLAQRPTYVAKLHLTSGGSTVKCSLLFPKQLPPSRLNPWGITKLI